MYWSHDIRNFYPTALDTRQRSVYDVCMHNVNEIISALDHLDSNDLDCLQAAIDSKRSEFIIITATSTVVERRNHLDGILQLEYRTNPKTGKQRGPYWYFKHRVDGRQRTIYVGATDDPIAKLSNERKDRAYEVES